MSKNIILNATKAHRGTVIFLHGLGDTGNGWASTMKHIQKFLPHLKFILPTAPTVPVSLNFGMAMPAWYDITALDHTAPEDEKGIKRSVEEVHQIIKREMQAGLPSEKIIVGGFSQGGAIALYSGLTLPLRLGGIIALSTYLPLRHSFPLSFSKESESTPILMIHGTADPIVRFEWGKMSFDFLAKREISSTTGRQDHDDNNNNSSSSSSNQVDPSSMSVSQLKQMLQERGIDYRDCIEKSDLVAKLKQNSTPAAAVNPNLEFKVIPGMAHEATMEEVQYIAQWLKKVLPDDDA